MIRSSLSAIDRSPTNETADVESARFTLECRGWRQFCTPPWTARSEVLYADAEQDTPMSGACARNWIRTSGVVSSAVTIVVSTGPGTSGRRERLTLINFRAMVCC